MALDLAMLNARGLRDPSKCSSLLVELSKFNLNAATVQETHFTCTADCRLLEDDYVVFSEYGSRSSIGISLLVGRSLNADQNLVFVDDKSRLVVADVAVKSFDFRVAAVYAPNIAAERVSLFLGWL